MRRNERGIALLLALLVLTILIILIAQMSVTAANNKAVTQNYLNDLQNGYGARAGYHQGVLYIEAEMEKGSKTDSLGAKWAQPITVKLGASTVKVSIEDSERRINLSQINTDDGKVNAVVGNQLRRLCEALGHPTEVAERILDYIDADTKGNYEEGARNARPYNLEELLRVKDVPKEALYGGDLEGKKVGALLDFVTLWPRSKTEGAQPGVVNVNTAAIEVLLSLSDKMSASVGQGIVAYRTTRKPDGSLQSFESAEDLKKVNGMTEDLFNDLKSQGTVQSTHFEIRVRSTVGHVSKSWLYVVRRQSGSKEGEAGKIALVSSQKTSDFLSVAPPEEKK